MFLIGGLEDQIQLYLWGEISTFPFTIANKTLADATIYQNLFRSLIHPFSSNQPFIWVIYSLLGTIFNGNFVNMFAIITLVVTFIISYLYFKKYSYPIYFSALFTFSTYMLTHIGRHIALTQIWLIPLFFMAIEKENKRILKLAAVLALAFITSNYIGAFLFLTYGIISIIKIFKREIHIKHFIFTILLALTLMAPTVIPYATAIFNPTKNTKISLPQAKKSIGEFMTFSSRPWYFFIPPVKNVLLGEFSNKILTKIENTNYFLADDYFANEHQSNYFGGFFIISLTYLMFRNKNKFDNTYLIAAMGLIMFMMPPFFTITGLKFYTPGWLIYKFLPVFRVTARMGIIVLFLLLSIYSKLLTHNIFDKKVKNIFVTILFIVTLLETFIPIKIYKAETPPEVYQYLGNQDNYFNIMVYPYDKTQEGFLWLPVHNKVLLNPRGYRNETYDAELLTKILNTEKGLDEAINLGVNKIVIFENSADNFFENNDKLEIEKEFSNTKLYKIIN